MDAGGPEPSPPGALTLTGSFSALAVSPYHLSSHQRCCRCRPGPRPLGCAKPTARRCCSTTADQLCGRTAQNQKIRFWKAIYIAPHSQEAFARLPVSAWTSLAGLLCLHFFARSGALA
eukprot:jgi/Tetstr1/447876/TSEL_035185.t1